jgi:hypothetical protein
MSSSPCRSKTSKGIKCRRMCIGPRCFQHQSTFLKAIFQQAGIREEIVGYVGEKGRANMKRTSKELSDLSIRNRDCRVLTRNGKSCPVSKCWGYCFSNWREWMIDMIQGLLDVIEGILIEITVTTADNVAILESGDKPKERNEWENFGTPIQLEVEFNNADKDTIGRIWESVTGMSYLEIKHKFDIYENGSNIRFISKEN